MKFFFHNTFLILLLYSIFACNCKTCGDNNESDLVVDSIFTNADMFIISIAGNDFFDKYITRDYIKSQKKSNNYHLFYKLKKLDQDFIDEEIHFYTDSSGIVLDSLDFVGIPKCEDFPNQCIFNVDKEEAIDIALSEKILPGIRDWEVSFRWSEIDERYVWHILSTLEESGAENGYKGKGEELILNPYNGEVIDKRDWEVK